MRNMITTKERVEQFKRDCKSNEYYTKYLMECNQQIEVLDVKLTGLSSPNGNQGPKCENSVRPSPLELLTKQDYWIKERDETIKKINYISSTIAKITDPIDRQMVTDLLVEQKYYKHLIDKYGYSDISAIYKHVNKILSKVLQS